MGSQNSGSSQESRERDPDVCTQAPLSWAHRTSDCSLKRYGNMRPLHQVGEMCVGRKTIWHTLKNVQLIANSHTRGCCPMVLSGVAKERALGGTHLVCPLGFPFILGPVFSGLYIIHLMVVRLIYGACLRLCTWYFTDEVTIPHFSFAVQICIFQAEL